jgi:hypothetical protein
MHYDIFVSCAGEDTGRAQQLVDALGAEGVAAWLDSPAQDMSRKQRRARFEEMLDRTSSCAFLLTSAKLSARQRDEASKVSRRTKSDPAFRMIKVIYPGAGLHSELPLWFPASPDLDSRKIQNVKEIAHRLAAFSHGAALKENAEMETEETELQPEPIQPTQVPVAPRPDDAQTREPNTRVAASAEHGNQTADHDVARQPERAKSVAGVKQPQPSWFRGLPTWFRKLPRRTRIAAAGYAAVGVFSLAFGVARTVGASTTSALVVGGLATAPLILAFIGDRITGIKAFSVEISLSEVKAHIFDEGDFSGAVMESAEMGGSPLPALLTGFQSLMQSHSKLLRINLRDDKYWWSTRIFLVAALADDYTDAEALIFVRSGEKDIFVGIAPTRAVRSRLADRFTEYESAYRKLRSDSAPPAYDNNQQVANVLNNWSNTLQPSETAIKITVSSSDLKEWLDGELDTEELPSGPLTPLLRYRINCRTWRYSALTDHSQLKDVVDRNECAIRNTAAELEARLGGRKE